MHQSPCGGKIGLAKFKNSTINNRLTLNFRDKDKTVKFTIVNKVLTDQIDLRKTNIAKSVNIVHSYEGLVLKVVNFFFKEEFVIQSVHDCYLIDFQSSFIFIDLINEVLKRDLLSIKEFNLHTKLEDLKYRFDFTFSVDYL